MRGEYYVPPAVLNVPARIWHSVQRRVNGVMTSTYEPDEKVIWVSAKSYGGKEKVVDGVYSVEDTVQFTAYYDPSLRSSDRIQTLGDGSFYDIVNTPENIDMRGAFMRFTGRRHHGA